MVRIWNAGGVVVHATGLTQEGDVGIEGFAHEKGKPAKQWYAWATPNGWMIKVRAINDREETFQGSTFNLGLEVVTAVRRSL